MRAAVNGLVALLVAGALVGCDSSESADRKANAAFEIAKVERRIGGEKGDAEARKALEPVANDGNLSPVTRAHAKSMLAQLEADTAIELMRQIDRKEMDLSRLAFELSQLALQLDVGALLVSDYSKYDPKPIQEKIEQQITAARGSADQPTWDYQGVQLPTLEGVKKKIADLEGELAKLQDQVKGLSDGRNTALAEAETAQQASDNAKGEESVAKFKEASAQRKKAAELFTQADQITVSMQPIERQLAIAQGQQQVVNDVITQLTAQAEALKSGWQVTQEKINAQVQLAKQIVGDSTSAAPPPSDGANATTSATVAQKAAEINRLASDIKTMRGDAQSKLDSAIKMFNDAYKAAEELRLATRKKMDDEANQNRPERDAWKRLLEVMDSQYYRLREASAQRMLASLYASEAASLKNRINLKAGVVPTIERAGAEVPAALTPRELDKDFLQAVNLADVAYAASDKILGDMLEGTAPKETKDAAKVERILVMYGWAQVDKMGEKTKDAEGHLQQAVAIRNDAAQEQIRLPALPAELGTAPAPPPPAPETTQPTETSASASAEPDPAIRAVLTQFADAAEKGDAEAAKAFCQIEPGGEDLFAASVKLIAEMKKFVSAVDTKFGAAAKPITDVLPTADKAFRNGTVTVKGDEAFIKELQEEGKPPKKDLVHVEGQWKVFIEAPKTDEEKQELAGTEKMVVALPQLTADVEAGKFANIEALQEAMGKAMGG